MTRFLTLDTLPRAGLLLASLLSLAGMAAAEVGQRVDAFTLEDAHKTAHTLSADVQRIYATADRKGDELLKTAMESLDQSTLDAQNAIVVADISEAPWFVKRIIRGSLKDRSYTTWMDREGITRELLPYQAGGVTIIDLDAFSITGVTLAKDAVSLRQALNDAAAPPPSQPDTIHAPQN